MSSRISPWRCALAALAVAIMPGARTAYAQDQVADTLVTRLTRLARETAPAVLARKADLRAATAAVEAAAPIPAPTLQGELENVPGGVRLDQAQQIRAGAEFLVFRGGRADALKTAARRREDAAAAAVVLSERRVEAGVRRSLVGYLAAKASDARLASEDSLLAEGEKALQLRFEQGEARYVDVLRLRTARLLLATDRASVQAIAVTRRQQVLGVLPDSLHPDASATMDAIARNHRPGDLVLLVTPPDSAVAALITALQGGAEASVEVARTARQTEIFGFAGVQRFLDIDNQFKIGPSLGFGVALPFLTPGSNRAAATAAVTGRDASIAAVEARRVTLHAALAQARTRYDAARARLDAMDAVLLAGARSEREAALAAYRSGQLSLIEFLDFERALGRADLARLEALIAAADAAAELDELPAAILLDLAPSAGAL